MKKSVYFDSTIPSYLMYTNDLLEEKYNAQREIAEKAKKLSRNYFSIVEEEVHELFIKMG